MDFEKGHLYHVYNQGNNRQKIFFRRENYAFFIQKIRTHLAPHADVVAWCLMPNHFHLMVYVHSLEIEVSSGEACYKTDGVTLSHPVSNSKKKRKINDSIAILLRSYTRAINIQENRSGNLFREATKAQCLTKTDDITPSYLNTSFGTFIHNDTPENDYPKVCFNYIHQNPAKANLVKNAEDWEFTSYSVYCGLKEDDGLVNMSRAEDFFEI
jgi:putative transposase